MLWRARYLHNPEGRISATGSPCPEQQLELFIPTFGFKVWSGGSIILKLLWNGNIFKQLHTKEKNRGMIGMGSEMAANSPCLPQQRSMERNLQDKIIKHMAKNDDNKITPMLLFQTELIVRIKGVLKKRYIYIHINVPVLMHTHFKFKEMGVKLLFKNKKL